MADEQDNSFISKLGRVFGANPDAAIDAAVTKGLMTPRYAQELKVKRQQEEFNRSVEQQSMAQPMTPQGAKDAQDAADLVENVAMKDTGVAPGFLPIQQPPLAPNPESQGLPSYVQRNPEVIDDALMKEEADAVADVVQQKVATDVQGRQIKEQQQAAQVAQEKDAALEQKVQDDNKNTPGWGRTIANAIAIMMGAYSQGLTGAKENPAIVAIEKEIERQAAARKYTAEQRQKLTETMLKEADLKLKQQAAMQESAYMRAKIAKMGFDVQKGLQEMQGQKSSNEFYSKKMFTDEDRRLMVQTKDGRDFDEYLVPLPGGGYAAAIGKEDAKKLRMEVIPGIENSLYSAKKLKEMTDYFGNNPIKKTLSRTEIGKVKPLLQSIIGSIRLEFFGPGVLTDNEQAIARSMIGNPTELFSIASANKAKINVVIDKLKFAKRNRLRAAGIDLPESPNDRRLRQAMAANPGAKQEDVLTALIESGKWNPDED